MAALRFYFGTMGSGKSTVALQIHHNLSSRNQRGLLCTRLSREESQVSSRLGVARQALEVEPDVDLYDVARSIVVQRGRLDYLVCDEACFYEPEQAEQLARVVDDLDSDVYAFGLLTDFRGQLFAATTRFLELADERIELRVESRCWCGEPATHNARLVNGHQVYDGDTVVVGDFDDGEAEIAYDVLCRRHWREGIERARQSPLPTMGAPLALAEDAIVEPAPIDPQELGVESG
ncbi:MAG: thymidine kinase [Actinomycetota bacterium]